MCWCHATFNLRSPMPGHEKKILINLLAEFIAAANEKGISNASLVLLHFPLINYMHDNYYSGLRNSHATGRALMRPVC
jgi:hypothetical protein